MAGEKTLELASSRTCCQKKCHGWACLTSATPLPHPRGSFFIIAYFFGEALIGKSESAIVQSDMALQEFSKRALKTSETPATRSHATVSDSKLRNGIRPLVRDFEVPTYAVAFHILYLKLVRFLSASKTVPRAYFCSPGALWALNIR